MGAFTYGTDTITIGDTGNIVLERLPIQAGDCEEFRLHRKVTYATTLADGTPFVATVPPANEPDWVTDLASVPQLLTWLVPTSGKHLPAALVHDALVDDPAIDALDLRSALLVGTIPSFAGRLGSALTSDPRLVALYSVSALPLGAAFGLPVFALGVRRFTHPENRAFAFRPSPGLLLRADGYPRTSRACAQSYSAEAR